MAITASTHISGFSIMSTGFHPHRETVTGLSRLESPSIGSYAFQTLLELGNAFILLPRKILHIKEALQKFLKTDTLSA